MKTLVTGAAGIIGTHVVRRLKRNAHSVYCLVRRVDGLQHLEELGAILIEGDVTDKASLLRGMWGCDWVVNLAEAGSYWEPDRRVYEDVNIRGTRNVMECALETGIAKVVHLTTAILYSNSTGHLLQRKAVNPAELSEYTRTKQVGDMFAWELYQRKALPLVMIYAAKPIGLNDTDSTTQHIRNVITRKARVRAFEDVVSTYVAVADLAEAIVTALEKDNNLGERYLVGGAKLSVREFDEILREITGVPRAKVSVPESLVFLFVELSTSLSRLTKRQPALGISADALRVFAAGLEFDGSRAQAELDLVYTPIRDALREAISSMQLEKHL